MYKIKRTTIGLFILLIIIGCKGSKDTNPVTKEESYTGTDALVFNFLKNAPPNQVYASTDTERSQFNIGVDLENKGASNIEDGFLTLILENDYMAIDDWPNTEKVSYSGGNQAAFSIEGRSLTNPAGGKDITTIKVNARKFPEQMSETHKSSILLATCYKYQTNVYENVCIDTDVYDLKNLDKACKVKDLSLNSQGAPVSVTKVEVEMLPHESDTKIKPFFTIYVENKGKGEVIRPDLTVIENACSSESLKIQENDLNVVNIKAYLSGKEFELDCNPQYIKLRDKKGYVRCNLKEGKEKKYGTYESPLIIDLYYGYMETIAKEVEIKKPVTY